MICFDGVQLLVVVVLGLYCAGPFAVLDLVRLVRGIAVRNSAL